MRMRAIQGALFGTVFVTGAAVLIVEVSAVRLLAPYFGASLYVLSSVLTTVLLALSLGYYIGGKLSDRYPSYRVLYGIIAIGGCMLLFLTLLLERSLPELAPSVSLLYGPLLFSLLFFFTPAFLLGIDSPFVARLLSLKFGEAQYGRVVGTTFFWSTTGSIVGSVLSGFVFIPLFGLNETITVTGIVLVLVGCVGLVVAHYGGFAKDTKKNLYANFSLFTLVFAGVVGVLLFTYESERAALYTDDGYYSHITIYDDTYAGIPARFLKREANSSSAVFLEPRMRSEPVFWYTQFASLSLELRPEASKYLVLGGGAYTIPRTVHDRAPEMDIDVVEIEPSLHALAKEYFFLPDTERITNHVMDARAYLARTDEVYDIIFVDAFSSGLFVPAHLATEEFLALARTRLSPDGVVLINFIGSREQQHTATLTGSFTKTLTRVFPHVSAYALPDRSLDVPQNIMYVLGNTSSVVRFANTAEVTTYAQNYGLDEMRLDTEEFVSSADIVLTDNNQASDRLLFQERALD